MKQEPIYTLEGGILSLLESNDLTSSDRIKIHKLCTDFIENFHKSPEDTRTIPDFQEEGCLIKILTDMGFNVDPQFYRDEIGAIYGYSFGDVSISRSGDLLRKGILNRRFGRVSLEREGD